MINAPTRSFCQQPGAAAGSIIGWLSLDEMTIVQDNDDSVEIVSLEARTRLKGCMPIPSDGFRSHEAQAWSLQL